MRGKRTKEADRRRGWKTISKSGQEWTLPAQLGQLKTRQDGKGLLRFHLWCSDDLPMLWDRIENRVCDSCVLTFEQKLHMGRMS